MTESPLFWPARMKGRVLLVLDETQIPSRVRYIRVRGRQDAVRVIRQMKTRAFGQLLVVLNAFYFDLNKKTGRNSDKLLAELGKTARALNVSRPTFPFAEVTGMVLCWAQQARKEEKDVAGTVARNIQGYLKGIRDRRLERVRQIAGVIRSGDAVLTHCNVSGELAMAAALCRQQKKKVRFYATETRPYFQGAKLTAWELKRMGADVTLVADNAVGSLMHDKLINKVIVGSDRSCANGDIANKVGTYQIAVLAREFGIPFYALTQPSDKIPSGKDIPIEFRDPKELLVFRGKTIAPAGMKGLYPGFDVVPHRLIKRALAIEVR